MNSQSLKKKLIKGGSWVTIGFAVNSLAGLAIGILLTHILPPGEVGTYFLAFSLVVMGSNVAQFGMNRTIVRFTSQSLATEDPGRARIAIIKALTSVALIATAFAAVFSSGAGSWVTSVAFSKSQVSNYVMLIGLWLSLTALRSITAESFRGLHNVKMAALSQRILHNVLLAGGLALLWMNDADAGLQDILLLAAGSTFIVLLYAGAKLAVCVGEYPKSPRTELPLSEMFLASWPIFLSQTLIIVMNQAPIWILGDTQPETEIAFFGTAMRIAMLTSVPLLITNSVLMPFAASLYAEHKHERLAKLLRMSAALAALPSLAFFLLFILGGETILSVVFGSIYQEGATALRIISAGYFFNVLAGSASVALTMSGNEHLVMKSAVFSCITSITVGFLLIPEYGASGAAAATTIGLVLYNLLLCWKCSSQLNLRTYIQLLGIRELYYAVKTHLKE